MHERGGDFLRYRFKLVPRGASLACGSQGREGRSRGRRKPGRQREYAWSKWEIQGPLDLQEEGGLRETT